MNLTEAAHMLGMSARTLPLAIERGESEADHLLAAAPWVFKRSVPKHRLPERWSLVSGAVRTRAHYQTLNRELSVSHVFQPPIEVGTNIKRRCRGLWSSASV